MHEVLKFAAKCALKAHNHGLDRNQTVYDGVSEKEVAQKSKTPQRFQSVRSVDDTPHTQENDMKNVVSFDAASKAAVLGLSS